MKLRGLWWFVWSDTAVDQSEPCWEAGGGQRVPRGQPDLCLCAVTQNILRYVQHVADGASTDKGEMDVGGLGRRCSGDYCECDTSEPCRRSDVTDHSDAQINMGCFFKSQCHCSFFNINLE